MTSCGCPKAVGKGGLSGLSGPGEQKDVLLSCWCFRMLCRVKLRRVIVRCKCKTRGHLGIFLPERKRCQRVQVPETQAAFEPHGTGAG